jgi:hypothetical protein
MQIRGRRLGMLKQETRSSTTRSLWLTHVYMKTLTDIRSRSPHGEHFAVPRKPNLVGQWQRGVETISGHAQWKLHLCRHRLTGRLTSNNSHEHAIHSSNGNGHLPLWWIRR